MLTLVETNFRPPYDFKYKCTKVNNNKHKSLILRLYTTKCRLDLVPFFKDYQHFCAVRILKTS